MACWFQDVTVCAKSYKLSRWAIVLSPDIDSHCNTDSPIQARWSEVQDRHCRAKLPNCSLFEKRCTGGVVTELCERVWLPVLDLTAVVGSNRKVQRFRLCSSCPWLERKLVQASGKQRDGQLPEMKTPPDGLQSHQSQQNLLLGADQVLVRAECTAVF